MQGNGFIAQPADPRKEKLIRTYKIYNIVDWMIVIAVIAANMIVLALAGLGIGNISAESVMYSINNAPAIVIVPVALISLAYTVWSMILYVQAEPYPCTFL